MRCVICDSSDWMNVDQYRVRAVGMSVCKCCGFVSYPSRWKSKEEIVAYYRKNYRKTPPGSNNLFTGERKLNYHASFLEPLFDSWKKQGIDPVIGEVGSAYGLVLAYFKSVFPKADINGTELTQTMKRVAWHQFQINLKDDLDWSKKYDMIMTYKVAEHQLDIDHELQKYHGALNDSGRLYISVPIWFQSLTNFGLGGFDLQTYYDPDHVNVWSRKLFEALLKKTGFKILKRDHLMYDSTYLCEKTEPQKLDQSDFDTLAERVKDLEVIKVAHDLLHSQKYAEAAAMWKDFPQAHIAKIEFARKLGTDDWEKYEKEYLVHSLECCPESVDLMIFVGSIYSRFNRWDQAIKLFEAAAKLKPGNCVALENLADTLVVMSEHDRKEGNIDTAIHLLKQARNVWSHIAQKNKDRQFVAIDKIYALESMIPTPEESHVAKVSGLAQGNIQSTTTS